VFPGENNGGRFFISVVMLMIKVCKAQGLIVHTGSHSFEWSY
jgi:hypothetical protein